MFHTIKLSKSDPTPLYIQLASELAKLIQSDILIGGTKLPAIRLLSRQLSINRDTVVSAYKLLENQGLVEGHIGKGTYVISKLKQDSEVPSTIPHICCSQLSFSKTYFPTSLCLELSKQIIQEEGWDAFNDPHYRERHFLKQSASNFLEDLGIRTHFAQIRIIQSLETFYLNLFKYSPKHGICVEEIRDLSASCYLRSMGAKLYEVPLTSEGLDLDCLERHLKTGNISYILVSPYLHNPTGICYSDENKRKLCELAEHYDAYIIEDGTLNTFTYTSTKPRSLYPYFSKDRVIYLYHFSKLYMPYMNYSFAILPTPMVKKLCDDTTCSFNERLLRYYLNSDFLKQLRNTLYEESKYKYQILYNYLIQNPELFELPYTYGGLSFWLRPLKISSENLYNYFAQHHIIVSPGNLFSSQNNNAFFRLSITQISSNDISLIIQLLNSNKLPTFK